MQQTINEVEVNGVKYVRKDSIETNAMASTHEGLKCVLVRSYAAGVHFGYLKDEKFTEAGKVVTLVNTRRVWYWDGAASLSQMALEGVSKPGNCKSLQSCRMETVNKGDGYGSGYGSGYGYGSGDGYGSGSGYGSGDGDGYGSGDGEKII